VTHGETGGGSDAFASTFARSFPALVGRIHVLTSRDAQPCSCLDLSALLGAGADVEGLPALLADAGSRALSRARWSPLVLAADPSSAEALAQPHVLVDAAIACAGPLVTLRAHFDPLALMAADLLRSLS
jgi:hypothetical protein